MNHTMAFFVRFIVKTAVFLCLPNHLKCTEHKETLKNEMHSFETKIALR